MSISPPWNVLVFPGGTEIGLEINRALRDCKEVRLVSAGAPLPGPAEVRYRYHEAVPSVTEDGWLAGLRAVVERHKIDFIFPGHDDVLLALCENAADVPARVVTSPLETARITRCKSLTYRALEGCVRVPRLLTAQNVSEFPVFVKPDRGQGSLNARRVDDVDSLRMALRDEGMLVMEYLPGTEYTVDCFSDRERGLQYCRARVRQSMRAGISMNTQFVEDHAFTEMARAMAPRLNLHGAWFFQAKLGADGEPRVLEVAPRIGGAAALSRVAGVNLPLLSLFEAARIPVEIRSTPNPPVLRRALDNYYVWPGLAYSTAYVDLDDTLILNGAVNVRLIRLLFQCLNRGIRLVLLTRCAQDLPALLAKHRLGGIFDDVVHVPRGVRKSSFIREPDAIFIDDSFAERREVETALGIPTFSPCMVEGLFDDRA